jgi:putative heme-binding domain-containing protein
LARRDGTDSWIRLAILSSVNGRAGEMFRSLLADKQYRATEHGRSLLLSLAGLIGSANRADEITALGDGIDALPEAEQSLVHALGRVLIAKLSPDGREQFARLGGKAAALLDDLVREALNASPDDQRTVSDRVAAIRLLDLAPFDDTKDLFRDLLKVRQPHEVQATAVETLARIDTLGVPSILLDAWPGFSPQLRASAVETMFSRPVWTESFLDAVQRGKLNRADVDAVRIRTLVMQADAHVQARVAELFAGTQLARRQDVVTAYQKALELKGDPLHGKTVFKKECSACHQLEGVGFQAGADLSAIRDQGTEAILLNILDPNREVKPQFQSYVVATDTGRLLTGLITAETANSLTIRRVDGTTETVLRIHIEQMKSTLLSFMPEGLEKQIDVPSMADLLAYLTSIK